MSLCSLVIMAGVICLVTLEMSVMQALPLTYSQAVAMSSHHGVFVNGGPPVGNGKIQKRDVWSVVDGQYAPFSSYESDLPAYEDSFGYGFDDIHAVPQKRLRFVSQNIHPGRRLATGGLASNPSARGSSTPGTPQTTRGYAALSGLSGQKFRFHRG
ncbi:uncharacterized protein LOC129592034 [Paramacrobiotus metropolitanus]|uniref:uncharacterized protein LOC129592034 n=1 Tax=Paramacrobiotus metropolitanus TaxID=2943436 RepID=UPI00244578AD|nr:uncharacterized protein LOC129592034 [Paramacrobiotus metropolitanus]